jgi:Holliday junction resolvase RusA-like endonuclease
MFQAAPHSCDMLSSVKFRRDEFKGVFCAAWVVGLRSPINISSGFSMNKPYRTFVNHIPFAKPYRGKRPQDAKSYDRAVYSATKGWPKVTNACQLKVSFILPPNKFSDTNFLGPDLDNLLKRLLDDLKKTVFASPADDSFVVSLEVTKTKVSKSKAAGVHIEIVPLHTILRTEPASAL